MIIDVFIVFDERRNVLGVFTNYNKAYEYTTLNRNSWYIERYTTSFRRNDECST